MTVAEPIGVQMTPSAERLAVKLFPLRVSCTQYGSHTPGLVTVVVDPPELVRYLRTAPFTEPGLMAASTSALPAARLLRIMTPARAL